MVGFVFRFLDNPSQPQGQYFREGGVVSTVDRLLNLLDRCSGSSQNFEWWSSGWKPRTPVKRWFSRAPFPMVSCPRSWGRSAHPCLQSDLSSFLPYPFLYVFIFPVVFCAGLDLKQMVQPRLHEFVPFWSSFLRCFVALFNSRLVTVAGINGHAIAGGTVLALACDYRVMLRSSKSGGAGKVFQVGLSEVSIGLPVPDWICSVLERVVGTRSAERMTTTGKLFSADAAVGEGLVDKAVDLSDEVVLASFHLLEIHLKAPSHHSRSLVKSYFRKPLSHSLLGNLDEISTSMFDTLKLPPIQTAVQANAKPSKKRSRL